MSHLLIVWGVVIGTTLPPTTAVAQNFVWQSTASPLLAVESPRPHAKASARFPRATVPSIGPSPAPHYDPQPGTTAAPATATATTPKSTRAVSTATVPPPITTAPPAASPSEEPPPVPTTTEPAATTTVEPTTTEPSPPCDLLVDPLCVTVPE